uniref:ATP synthase subunit a n=1 Tax=Robertsicus elaphensis TaxID=2599317 RepID=H9M751_9ACAR|nr:ATP synthase F0 subunit 6 [Robertsicus elaphensis]AET63068.1 ATP synthase F0 subunit 6 [Robertsicus elaphensis]
MVNNLFSIFDPSTTQNFNLNWLTLIMIWPFIPNTFWFSSSLLVISWKKLLKKFFQEITNSLKVKKHKFIIMIYLIFMMIVISNLIGLLPYMFTNTSHLVFCMFLAFPFWFALMFFGILNKINKMMIYFVPKGSPIFLSFFMVIIESISNFIRPITLSIRLMANMVSGHLLIHLLSSLLNLNVFSKMMFPIFLFLMILEMMVAVIQGIVFIILITLFLNEI